ncbi:hypothetical protein QQX98_009281 [Neonectria punicea]|uniref:Uncharacterized protein n=1 Tax=Neonectria punicea TaxID=979145 RepID=A0ABR1GT29_9HYPO
MSQNAPANGWETTDPRPIFDGPHDLNRTNPLHLGKNRLFADVGHWKLPKEWRKGLQKEIKDAKKAEGEKTMHRNRIMCWTFSYGRDAPWPPMDPSLDLRTFAKHMEQQGKQTSERYRSASYVVLRKELEIQDTIFKISNGEIPGVDLDSVLETAWKEATKDYNKRLKITPDGILPGSELDGEKGMSKSHSSDLEAFSLDFLDNIKDKDHGYCATYRNGANYRDHQLNPRTLQRPGEPKLKWPYLFAPPLDTGLSISYNKAVQQHYRGARASYLVPHINLEDLRNPANLLKFIHYRARTEPAQFARMDSDLMYLGRSSKMLAGAFSAMQVVVFDNVMVPYFADMNIKIVRAHGSEIFHMDETFDCFGIAEEDRERYRALHMSGHTFGTMEAWLVMDAQSFIYTFLCILCVRLFGLSMGYGLATHGPEINGLIDPALPPEDFVRIQDAAGDTIEELRAEGETAWRDLPSLRQYEPVVQSVNDSQYLGTLQAKKELAEEHLTRLFEDPDYFAAVIFDQKEHHWQNLPQNYDAKRGALIEHYEAKNNRKHLYYDCLRSVLRRAVFGFFIWPLVEKRLTAFCDELDDFRDDENNGHDKRLPINVAPQLKKNRMLYKRYHDVVYVVRFCAVLFLKEFATKLIHASSEPMRENFFYMDDSEPWDDNPATNAKCKFQKGVYKDRYYTARSSKRTLNVEDDTTLVIVGGMINNFLASRPTAMYAGVRKVTARLQRLIDDCEDEETSEIFTQLVADTIDDLDVLAEIAQHLEDFSSTARHIEETPEEEFQQRLSAACVNDSIDFLAFDDFPYEINGVPDKRIERIFTFLEELQGFDKVRTINYGKARGDLKRLGASLLKKMIVPTNDNGTYKASNEALERLEETMGVTRDEYPFHPKEVPIDLDARDKIPHRWPTEHWIRESKRIKTERAKLYKRLHEQVTEAKKGFEGHIVEHEARERMQKRRQEQELQRWRRLAQRRRKKRRSERAGGTAGAAPEAGEDVEMGEEDDDEDEPMEDEPRVEEPQVEEPQVEEPQVEEAQVNEPQIEVDELQAPEPEPQPVPRLAGQLPLPEAPPGRDLPLDALSLGPNLAPDGEPKASLNKRVWETLLSLHGKTTSKTTYGELARALHYMGYRDEGRGGSHGVFMWTPACRWKREDLPKGHNIQVAKNHEGENKAAAQGKVRDWGFRLSERGMTWAFIQKWYQKRK